MKVHIYLCGCGTIISGMLDVAAISSAFGHDKSGEQHSVIPVDFICSEEGQAAFTEQLRQDAPERVVVAACSPRSHEATFRRCLTAAGINPYLLQMVNVREQIVWVTTDAAAATEKCIRALRGAVARVQQQEALQHLEREVCPHVLVIGAGPAGLSAAQALAEAGRRVILVERRGAIGGAPVRFEKVFPTLECASCMVEPRMMAVLHGDFAGTIELLTLAEVVQLNGWLGNFQVKIAQKPRHVVASRCISCGQCTAVCPVSRADGRRAIDTDRDGALPAVPSIDESACLRFRGAACQLCQGACPVAADVIRYEERVQVLEREVGAVIVAIGAELYDYRRVTGFAESGLPDLYSAHQFQEKLAASCSGGWTVTTAHGATPASIALIHCVGSLDQLHCDYCSGICCQYALAFSCQLVELLPEVRIRHYVRELVLPGKQGAALYQRALRHERISFQRYTSDDAVQVTNSADGMMVRGAGDGQAADMVVLCSAVVPNHGAAALAALLDAPLDSYGFFQELHGVMDPCRSRTPGIYPVGMCREPMVIAQAVAEGMAAAALVQAELQPGRMMTIEPIYAEVSAGRCSGCRLCVRVCPYRAITFDEAGGTAVVNPLHCRGCGTCVAGCPASAIKGRHFTDEQIMAEISGLLS